MNVLRRGSIGTVLSVVAVLALVAGALLYFSPEASAIEDERDPEKAHLWYDANGYWCGEIVYWCDGSVTETNPYCGPTMETRYWQCPGDGPFLP